jgi:hypothetical protein
VCVCVRDRLGWRRYRYAPLHHAYTQCTSRAYSSTRPYAPLLLRSATPTPHTSGSGSEPRPAPVTPILQKVRRRSRRSLCIIGCCNAEAAAWQAVWQAVCQAVWQVAWQAAVTITGVILHAAIQAAILDCGLQLYSRLRSVASQQVTLRRIIHKRCHGRRRPSNASRRAREPGQHSTCVQYRGLTH